MPDTHGQLILTSQLVATGADPRPVQRAARTPELTRVRRGAYLDTRAWQQATREQRYRHLVLATASMMRSPQVLSHESAAVMHGLPLVGRLPDVVHVIGEPARGGRSSPAVRRHCILTRPEVVVVDGLAVTSVAQTVVDVARTRSFHSALATADHALAKGMTTRDELHAAVDAIQGYRGCRRAGVVLTHADPRAESPGESVSRAQMIQLGLPVPVLQKEFFDDAGFIGRVDFWWEEEDVVGEFDGRTKYMGSQMHNGVTPGDVVWQEKIREDRLRRQCGGVVRWVWSQALDREALRVLLAGAGVHRRRPGGRRSAGP